jgi:hypothetical protein
MQQLHVAAVVVSLVVVVRLTAAAVVDMPAAANTDNPQLLHFAARLCPSGGTNQFRRFALSGTFRQPDAPVKVDSAGHTIP